MNRQRMGKIIFIAHSSHRSTGMAMTIRAADCLAKLQAGRLRATDDGGHYIARRFNGPTDAFNHFAQNANFNRGGYRALEDRWAKAIRDGKKVRVKIIPFYRAAPALSRSGFGSMAIDL